METQRKVSLEGFFVLTSLYKFAKCERVLITSQVERTHKFWEVIEQ